VFGSAPDRRTSYRTGRLPGPGPETSRCPVPVPGAVSGRQYVRPGRRTSSAR
jgi:hypothetical protein